MSTETTIQIEEQLNKNNLQTWEFHMNHVLRSK